MNKSQIVNRVARNHNLSKREAARVVNTFCEGISTTLQRGGSVQIAGFGSFSIRQVGGFTARNPRTGVGRRVAPSTQVVFTPSSSWMGRRQKPLKANRRRSARS